MSRWMLMVFFLGAMSEALSQDNSLLVLPKGSPVTVTGMTLKGGLPAPQATAVTASWDDEALTVVFDCADTTLVSEWADVRDSEKTWKDDSVAVLLDIGHRHREADNLVMFKLSVAGGLQDCRGKERNIAFNVAGATAKVALPPVPITWRIMPATPEQIKAAASTIPPNHWHGTIRIPWRGLGVKPNEGDVWGVNFTRIDQPGLNFMAWSPFGENFEEVRAFGHLVFAPKDAGDAAHWRESVRQAHAGIARDSVNAGNCLTLSGKQPASVAELRLVKSGDAARQATTAEVNWSATGLDVVFECLDDGIVADQKGRDNIKLWKDDSVYLWLDPGHTHDPGNTIMVQVSATGEVLDSRSGDVTFDVQGMTVEASRTDRGWRAHVVLPWPGLGVATPQPGEVWGFNLSRIDHPGKSDYQNMQSSSWVLVPDGDLLAQDRWGHVVFSAPGNAPANESATLDLLQKSHEARREKIADQFSR